MALFVGVDPGGKNAFGWCVLQRRSESVCTVAGCGTASTSREALSAVFSACYEPPLAIGVDAPLYWSADKERIADRNIRRVVSRSGGHSATVGHVNSLRGACLVQGVLAAVAAQQRWPNIKITEAHPKALLWVWPPLQTFLATIESAFKNEHERDAAIAAYSALQYHCRGEGWKDWVSSDDAPFFPTGRPLAYWFPG